VWEQKSPATILSVRNGNRVGDNVGVGGEDANDNPSAQPYSIQYTALALFGAANALEICGRLIAASC
jgi:hypothetical protein